MNMIRTQRECSELFDEAIGTDIHRHHPKDDSRLYTAFVDWIDGLERNGMITNCQAMKYTYVGLYRCR